jgi:hypothetical protein
MSMLRPVYNGEHGLRTPRELGRSYQTISQDLNRVMNRIKALYRGWPLRLLPVDCLARKCGLNGLPIKEPFNYGVI